MTETEQYLAAQPEDRRQRLRELMGLVHQLYPAAELSMKYRMPTHTTEQGWLAVANQKHYVSFYTCNGEYLQAFRDKHPEVPAGKGCLNFRDGDDLHLADLAGVVHLALGAGD